jgi:hypothetical protein
MRMLAYPATAAEMTTFQAQWAALHPGEEADPADADCFVAGLRAGIWNTNPEPTERELAVLLGVIGLLRDVEMAESLCGLYSKLTGGDEGAAAERLAKLSSATGGAAQPAGRDVAPTGVRRSASESAA